MSPSYPPTSGRCLKFYYSIANNKDNKFAMQVILEAESGDSYILDEVTGTGRERKWSLAETNVVSSTNFRVKVER